MKLRLTQTEFLRVLHNNNWFIYNTKTKHDYKVKDWYFDEKGLLELSLYNFGWFCNSDDNFYHVVTQKELNRHYRFFSTVNFKIKKPKKLKTNKEDRLVNLWCNENPSFKENLDNYWKD